mgnify:CR=1 FL=1
MRIAIDVMGGDEGPRGIVDGALVAARHLQAGLLLVGPAAVIEGELRRHPSASVLDVRLLDTPEYIEMGEDAPAALRRKPRASIRLAAEAVRDGEAAALFSAGHTGATVMAAVAACMIKGVERVMPMIHFDLRGVEVKLHGVRQDSPPKIVAIDYEIVVDSDEDDRRLELLHTNVRKYGTISNTLAAATKLAGSIRRKAQELP